MTGPETRENIMAKRKVAWIDGIAANGAPHGVLVEAPEDPEAHEAVSVTITGADGRKRHATSVVCGDEIDHLIRALITVRGGEWLDALAAIGGTEVKIA
jgi:hypothetical protein